MRNWIGAIIRFIVSALVLLLVGYLVPGFTMIGFGNALIAAAIIALLGYIIEMFMGEGVSPQNRGIIGFIVSAIVIYFTQFIVPGLNVTLLGAILAAIVIGVIDVFVPTELK